MRKSRGGVGVFWTDMDLPEATWVMRVKEIGPLIMGINSQGNSLYNQRSGCCEFEDQRRPGKSGYTAELQLILSAAPCDRKSLNNLSPNTHPKGRGIYAERFNSKEKEVQWFKTNGFMINSLKKQFN